MIPMARGFTIPKTDKVEDKHDYYTFFLLTGIVSAFVFVLLAWYCYTRILKPKCQHCLNFSRRRRNNVVKPKTPITVTVSPVNNQPSYEL